MLFTGSYYRSTLGLGGSCDFPEVSLRLGFLVWPDSLCSQILPLGKWMKTVAIGIS